MICNEMQFIYVLQTYKNNGRYYQVARTYFGSKGSIYGKTFTECAKVCGKIARRMNH